MVGKYFSNPFVIIGSVGLVYYIWKRKQIMKNLPKFQKGKLNIERNLSSEEEDLPLDFVNDVKNMSKEEMLRTIGHNEKMLKRSDMSNKKRSGMERMLDFLAKEYDSREG